MNEKELKAFIINFISIKENDNKDYIIYSYYELKVKLGLKENEIKELLRVSKNYFENKNYKVYFTDEEFEYKDKRITVETNNYMIAVKQ